MKNNLLAVVICIVAMFIGKVSHGQIGPVNDSAVVGSTNINPKDTLKSAPKDTSVQKVTSTKPINTDTSGYVKHSPRKATLLSTFLPGAGQFYNKKYWKMPIIYAGVGGAIYGIAFYTKEYNNFREAYKIRLNTGTNDDPYYAQFQDATLQSYRDYYRYYRDMSYIILGAVYVLQIVDAAVDAHFYDFKITEDLSMNWQPVIVPGPYPSSQLLFTFKF